MSRFKKTNKLAIEQFITPKGNQELRASGAFVGTGNSHNITDGQLGVISWDSSSSVPVGNYLAANTTYATVKAIKLLQGTAMSNQLQNADVWEVREKDRVESQIIRGETIRSVSTVNFTPGALSVNFLGGFGAPEDNTQYAAYLESNSQRKDRNFGDNDDVAYVGFETPNYTSLATTAPLDHLVQNFVAAINRRSKAAVQGVGAQTKGNKDFLALAISTGAVGAGPVLNAIAIGDVLTVQTVNGVTTTIIATPQLVASIAKAINGSALLGTAKLVAVDLSTAGALAMADAFIVLGLEESTSAYFDDIFETRVSVTVNLAEGFLTGVNPVNVHIPAEESKGTGREVLIAFRRMAGLRTHTLQNNPHGDFFSRGVEYIDPAKNYAVTAIEFYDYEETLTTRPQSPKTLYITLEAAITTAAQTVSAAVTNLTAGNPAILTNTDAQSTVRTGLNTILSVWIGSIPGDIEYLGDSASGAIFV